MRSPIWWFGGKGKMTAKLLPLLDAVPHRRYVEPFGGGASLLLAKRPVEIEVYNDLDSGLYDFFSILADPEEFKKFHRRAEALPYSRELYNDCWANWRAEPDKIKRAAMWFVVARQSFGGVFGASWGSVVTASTRGMAMTCATWLSCLAMLPEIHARLTRVQIEHSDWRIILDRYDTPETLFYLDPPYVHDTRDKSSRYAHEMTADDHRDLVDCLLGLAGSAVLSGYDSPIYAPLTAAGWEQIEFQTVCHAAARTRATGIQGKGAALKMQPRTEVIWRKPFRVAGGLF